MPDVFALQYFHGHPLEIINTLSKRNKGRFVNEKFPFVALFQDFPEKADDTGTTATLHLIIANKTRQTYKAAERYEHNFIPILYPIWEALYNRVKVSRYVEYVNPEYTKTDRVFWGREGLYGNEGNIFNDFIDAIEIQNFIVKFKKLC
jgi:hypothetical protein